MTTPPPEPAFATLRELLAAVGHHCDCADDVGSHVEDYADGYLDEDLGMNLFVTVGEGDEGEWLSLRAAMSFYTDNAVAMWTLEAPFTVSGFHRYLDELDLRVTRLSAIVELPTAGDGSDSDSEDHSSIVSGLANLFDTDEADVVRQLDDEWLPIESDATGAFSVPVRYLLWNGRLIIGLDDEYGHVFVPTRAGEEVRVGDVMTSIELGGSATIDFSEFARVIQDCVPISSVETS